MSLVDVETSEHPLQADGLTHISTLASTSVPDESSVWKKTSPLRTYSKKTMTPVSPSPTLVSPSPTLVSPSSEVDNEDKSRYGRIRKLIPSDDFLSTDKKVSQYLKIRSANQFHNFRATYSNSKARSTPKKPKVPRKIPSPSLCRSLSMNYLPQPEKDEGSSKMTSVLDLAAPTCTETIETPLPLQEFESDSESDSMVPQDYSVGDLVWAAIPTYPYWPAMITRDPVTNLPYKLNGTGNKSRTLWHVHFFGDKGMRGWVVTRNTFVFDGLDSYNKAKADHLDEVAHNEKLTKREQKRLSKAFTVPNHYFKSWASAVSESQSLLASSRSDRLEHLISAYTPKPESLKKRQRSPSLCDLSSIPKMPRTSEPPPRRRSIASKTTEPIKPLGISARPKTVVCVIPAKWPKSLEKPETSRTQVENHLGPDSVLPDALPSTHSEGATNSPMKASLGVSSDARQSGSGVPLQLEECSMSSFGEVSKESQEIVKKRGRPKGSLNVPKVIEDVVLDYPRRRSKNTSARDTSAASLSGLGGSENCLKSEPVPERSPRKPTPLLAGASPLVSDDKIKRGRPRKISLPTPKELENPNSTPKRTKSLGRRSMPDPVTAGATPTILCAMGPGEPINAGITLVKAKSQNSKNIKSITSSVPTVTRFGRQSKKPEVLQVFTSPKKESKNINNSSQHVVSIKRGIIDTEETLVRVKTEPESPVSTPTSKRKRQTGNGRRKKIKLEPEECTIDLTIVKVEEELSKPASKPPKEPLGSPKNLQMRKISLFSGVKDGKLCSICLKAGDVKRCRGPCSLYMHEECSHKPRFVPDRDTAKDGTLLKKKQIKKKIAVNNQKNGNSKEDTDVPYSNSGSVNTHLDEICTIKKEQNDEKSEDSTLAPNDVEVQDNKSTENGIRNDSGLMNGPTSCRKSLRSSVTVVGGESRLNGICRVNENQVDEAELVIHMSESESFPESSGIPTPPPEDSAISPVSPKSDGSHEPSKLDQVDDDLASVVIKTEPIDSAESMTSDASEKDKNDASKKFAKDKGWVCNMCLEGNLGPCFACGKDDGERVRCKIGSCGKVFHLDCTKGWPQHTKNRTATGKLIFHCPAHTCHTCISDNPASLTSRYVNDRLVRCVRCPTTYHHGNFCVPAGSEILSSTQIICSRHFRQGRKSLGPVNASWCFLCSMGGSLICCDLCPNSFHVECLNISPPEGAYICEDCETGRFPLYGEIVWAKLGNYRWWPARILFPLEIPASLQRVEHVPGEFVVRFYGTYNYYWLHRGRVFLFHDGDGKKQESISLHSKKHSDGVFNRGVEEASVDFANWTSERNRREETHRTAMKPPKYVKISSNRAVGSVKLNEADVSSLTACDCKPDEEDPCGPDSDCINRLLLVECSPHICPAGVKCNNKNFEKRLYPPLAPFRTEYRGWGLKTLGPLKKGDFIIEYVGEMIDEAEYKRRLLEMQKSKDENFYFLTLDKDRMLDAGPKGNLSRFMNHSCQPNCETQKWTVEGNTRVGLFALQNIPAGCELVFNYNLMTTGDNKIECRCGAPNCAGFIGGKPNKPPSKPKDETSSNKNGNPRQRAKKKKRTQKKNLTKLALANSSAIIASSKVPPTKEASKCYACHETGATVACQDASCPQLYHLACLGLTKDPSKKWTCPWHECSVCGSRIKVENCSLCINAYCSEHQEGNIVLNRGKGSLCHNHNMSDSGSEWSTGEKDDDTAECRVNQMETKVANKT